MQSVPTVLQPLVQYAVQIVTSVAHRVPYGYGDWAVEFAIKRWAQYQRDSAAKEAAQVRALQLAQEAVARGEQLSVYPEWCDHGSRLFAYVCEQYLDGPVWCTVFILDGVALWLIFCILRRQWEQNREDKKARLSPPRTVRMRRLWGRLGAAVRVTAFSSTLSA